MFKRLVGDKAFYRTVIVLALPIMLQTGITNFVSMLDNIMVGRLDLSQMNGAAIANQLIFIYNLAIFGAVSGAGIFSAQFYGKRDWNNIRYAFRFKLLLATLISVGAILLFLCCADPLLNLYIDAKESAADKAATLLYGRQYLFIILIGLIPFALTQAFSGTLRECGESVVPMRAGIIAVAVNLVFNWLLIYGKFGFPRLGVAGAAVATVLSRFVELGIVVVWCLEHKEQFPFIKGALRSVYIPLTLLKRITAKGVPLMFNETMWAVGMAWLNQCYATRGLEAVAAANITTTFNNLFAVTYQAVGSAVGILVGHMLGASEFKKLKNDYPKLLAFAVAVSLGMGVLLFACADFIPLFYNVPPSVRTLATALIQITACAIPLEAYAFSSYFSLRAGGNMLPTILMDAGLTCCVNVPIIFLLARFTDLSVLYLCAIFQGLVIIKCIISTIMLKRGNWMRNIVE